MQAEGGFASIGRIDRLYHWPLWISARLARFGAQDGVSQSGDGIDMNSRAIAFERFAGAGKRRSAFFAVAGIALAFTIVTFGMLGYRVNLTPSEPLGLWRIKALTRPAIVGDLVFICPPKTETMANALQRGYLRSGLCAGGYAPLIKTIAATAGARVEISSAVVIDGHPLPHSALRTVDGQGRPLAAFSGSVVGAGAVFVHSPFPASFDSRYFGPIPDDAILGTAEMVLTDAR